MLLIQSKEALVRALRSNIDHRTKALGPASGSQIQSYARLTCKRCGRS